MGHGTIEGQAGAGGEAEGEGHRVHTLKQRQELAIAAGGCVPGRASRPVHWEQALFLGQHSPTQQVSPTYHYCESSHMRMHHMNTHTHQSYWVTLRREAMGRQHTSHSYGQPGLPVRYHLSCAVLAANVCLPMQHTDPPSPLPPSPNLQLERTRLASPRSEPVPSRHSAH